MNDFGRRVEDEGHESPMATLARIDENIKFLKTGALEVRERLERHEVEDDKKFKVVFDKLWEHARVIYIGLGIVGVVEVIMNLHK